MALYRKQDDYGPALTDRATMNQAVGLQRTKNGSPLHLVILPSFTDTKSPSESLGLPASLSPPLSQERIPRRVQTPWEFPIIGR